MKLRTLIHEAIVSTILAITYPIDWFSKLFQSFENKQSTLIVLIHGLGGSRANMLGLASYLKLAGFDNIVFFNCSTLQSISTSVNQLAKFIDDSNPPNGVHLIGHSLGGTIARKAVIKIKNVKSLITLCAPYNYMQKSPTELAFFGEDDLIVPPPIIKEMAKDAAKQIIILPTTSHLGILYHLDALKMVCQELLNNS